jgi:hypothetical protein
VKLAIAGLALLFGASEIELAGQQVSIGFFELASDAEARVGRPLTPVSAAGVARRTTRRVIRRTAYSVAVLPAGCVYGPYYGYNAYRCGSLYYQKSGNVYIQVTFD